MATAMTVVCAAEECAAIEQMSRSSHAADTAGVTLTRRRKAWLRPPVPSPTAAFSTAKELRECIGKKNWSAKFSSGKDDAAGECPHRG